MRHSEAARSREPPGQKRCRPEVPLRATRLSGTGRAHSASFSRDPAPASLCWRPVDPDEVYLLIRRMKHWAAWAHLVQRRISCPDPRAPWARLGRFRSATSKLRDRPLHIKSRQAVSFDQADRASLWQNASRQMLVHSGCGQVIAVFAGARWDLAHLCRGPGGEAAAGQIASELSQSGAAERNHRCR